MKEKCKTYWNQYKHIVPLLLYGILYSTWFVALERHVTSDYTMIHMGIDDYIPFCEVFVIPYFLWFLYVAAIVVYLFFTNKADYYRLCKFLFIGMTIFLLVSTFFPNGQNLRPITFPRDNIFTHMIAALYQTDSATNIVPSIHVYNAIGAHIAIVHCKRLHNQPWVRIGSFVLCLSIILSTMLIKQHSMFDVLTACGMAVILYAVVYADFNIQTSKEYRINHDSES
ncbi:MAG: serine/threonine protein phosphatase [Lachnospiraceae bacterium]